MYIHLHAYIYIYVFFLFYLFIYLHMHISDVNIDNIESAPRSSGGQSGTHSASDCSCTLVADGFRDMFHGYSGDIPWIFP